MKKQLLVPAVFGVVVGALFALLLTTPASAAGNILTEATNPHNFSSSSTNTVESSVPRKCDFCHTPHGANTAAGYGAGLPLWNRTPSTDAAVATWNTTFTAYNNPNGTIDAVDLDADLGPQSLACMSCHDGTITLDSLVNFPNIYPGGTADITFAAVAGRIVGEAIAPASSRYIGTDLTNDHPVGFTNPGAADPDLVTPIPAAFHFGAGDDQVECASCHQVHFWNTADTQFQPFLRATMQDSALCGSCHTK